MDPFFAQFVQDHLLDDTVKLLLSAHLYPKINMSLAVIQIEARRQIRDKLPSWYDDPLLIFPSKLAAEQCSSEATACYKASLAVGATTCDLTGGLGVDSYYFALRSDCHYYVERFADYCRAATANFERLGALNISVIHGDVMEIKQNLPAADSYYIDPARRGAANRRLFALTDYEPNLLEILPYLLPRSKRLIVKVSPMADIDALLLQLPQTMELHVVAYRGECKELLFILQSDGGSVAPLIKAVNIASDGTLQLFETTRESEAMSQPIYATDMGRYLYEPHAAILKSGAFKQVAAVYDMQKLSVNSHIYTSMELVEGFPGRIFEVVELHDFSAKLLKSLSQLHPKGHITARNFPLSVEQIRKKSGIREGGDCYLFATTIGAGRRVIAVCYKTRR